jgi:hypothetical protein
MRLLHSRLRPFEYFHVFLAVATLVVAPIVAAGGQDRPSVAGEAKRSSGQALPCDP